MVLQRCLYCLLLVVMGSVAVLWLLWTSPPESRDLQDQRQRRLQDVCNSTTWRTFEELSDSELKHFIVDDKHGIIYCYIPKVACTNWKKVLYVLSQGELYQTTEAVPGDFVHSNVSFTLLSSFPRAERQARLKHYTKFLFVRDPFVRLISAYRNKFEENKDTFYKQFGRYILQRYAHMPHPPDSPDKAFELGIRPSFKHFIQYLTDPGTEETEPFEPHWRQMHRLCHPCAMRFDFIGHLESLQEDANLLLKKLKLDQDVTFPQSYQVPVSADLLWDWFKTVPPEDRRTLYRMYEPDFRLFGYATPHRLLAEGKYTRFKWST